MTVPDSGQVSAPSEPIAHTQLTHKVYGLLRDKIVSRELLPGERIRAELLAQRFGVSRTPVKEALSLLAADGLIEIAPRRGTFVARLDWRAVEELYQLRLMIETFAAEVLVPTITQDQLRALRQQADEMQRCIRGDNFTDFGAYLDRDRALHASIVALLGNRRLSELYEGINLHMQLARALEGARHVRGARGAHQEHVDLLRALGSRDPRQARQAVTTHLRNARERFFARMGHADPAASPVPPI